MEERRRIKRFPADLIIMYEIIDKEREDISNLRHVDTPVAEDISLRGICFVSSQQLPPGLKILITLSSVSAHQHIEAIGQVCWNSLNEDSLYKCGVEFTKLEEVAKKILQELINQIEANHA